MTLDEKIKERIIEDALNSVGTDIEGNISAISLADFIYGRIQNSFQSRVKELEDKALTLGDIHEAHIIIIKQLERKLEVAREIAISADCHRLCDHSPELNYKEQYERSTVYVDNLLKQALTATKTSTKETEG